MSGPAAGQIIGGGFGGGFLIPWRVTALTNIQPDVHPTAPGLQPGFWWGTQIDAAGVVGGQFNVAQFPNSNVRVTTAMGNLLPVGPNIEPGDFLPNEFQIRQLEPGDMALLGGVWARASVASVPQNVGAGSSYITVRTGQGATWQAYTAVPPINFWANLAPGA